MTPDDLRQQIELKVVELIKAKMAEGTLSEERSQAISQHVLELLTPGMSWEELYRAVPKLDDSFPELAPIVLPIVREYEENVVGSAQEGVRQLVRQGQYDAAVRLAKKALDREINLVWTGSGKPSPESTRE